MLLVTARQRLSNQTGLTSADVKTRNLNVVEMFETLLLRTVTRIKSSSLHQRPSCLLCRNLSLDSHNSQYDERTEHLYNAICRGERAALGT